MAAFNLSVVVPDGIDPIKELFDLAESLGYTAPAHIREKMPRAYKTAVIALMISDLAQGKLIVRKASGKAQ